MRSLIKKVWRGYFYIALVIISGRHSLVKLKPPYTFKTKQRILKMHFKRKSQTKKMPLKQRRYVLKK